MKKIPIALLSMLLCTSFCYAGLLTESLHEKIIEQTLNNFWGKAVLKDGSFVQADSEEERKTVPISKTNAKHVILIGELSSLAGWCGLDWQQNYHKMTKAARDSGFTGKQVAFIGLLHGVTMGTVDLAVKERRCAPQIKQSIAEKLEKLSRKDLDFTPSPVGNITK